MTKSSVIDMYKMKKISILISLFGIINTKTLECIRSQSKMYAKT